MNRKKWQGVTFALMITLLAGTTLGANTRNVPKPSTMPITTTAPESAEPNNETKTIIQPQATEMPSAVPQPVTTPSEVPQATEMPSQAPQPTTMPSAVPQPTTTPSAMPEATTMPKMEPKVTMPSAQPKTIVVPKQSPCPETKTKPFMLDNFKVIANTLECLGVDENELTAYIKEGKKLEDVLKAEKISTRKFKRYVIKEYNRMIDAAVKNKQLTYEQGKQLKVAIKQTISNWLPRK